MAYIGKTPDGVGVRSRFYFTQGSSGATSLSGNDDAGKTLTFSDGAYVDVLLNGVGLVAGTDYNTTTANTIAGLAALASGDVVEVVVYDIFTVADTVSAGSGGTFAGAVGFSGGATFPDSAELVFGTGSDFKISHNGSKTKIEDTGTGNLEIRGTNIEFYSGDGGETLAKLTDDGAAELYHNNTKRIETSSTGVDITGSVTADGLISDSITNASGNLLIASTQSATIRFDSDNNQTNREFNLQRNTSTGVLKAEESGDITFFKDDGTTAGVFWDASSGFVGIGESTPRKILHITKNDSDGIIILDADGATTDHQICFSKDYGTGGTTGGNYWGIGVDGSENKLVFAYDANAQASLSADAKVILHSSGQLAINNDGTFRSNEKLTVKHSTDTSAMWCTAASGSVNMLSMYRGSGQTFVGSVETTGSATQYVSASDHRLKENVVDLTGAIDRLKTLSPRRFNFIAEPDTTLDGFIAHEVTACPEAVSGTHNAVDDDGNPKYQGLDASKLVPLLTGALQEAISKIETLETKVAALEAGE